MRGGHTEEIILLQLKQQVGGAEEFHDTASAVSDIIGMVGAQ